MLADQHIQKEAARIAEQVEATMGANEEAKRGAEEMQATMAGYAKRIVEQLESEQGQPKAKEQQAKDIQEQLEALMADPNLQKVGEQVKTLIADPNIQAEARSATALAEEFMVDPGVQEQAGRVTEQLGAMMESQTFKEKAQLLFEQMDALKANPESDELANVVAEGFEAMMADASLLADGEHVAERVQTMMENPKLEELIKGIEARLGSIMGTQSLQEHAKSFARQFQAIMADAKPQEAMGGSASKLFAKLFDRAMNASPHHKDSRQDSADKWADELFHRAMKASPHASQHLDESTLGKTGHLATRTMPSATLPVFSARPRPPSPLGSGGFKSIIPFAQRSWAQQMQHSPREVSKSRGPVTVQAEASSKEEGGWMPSKTELKKMVPLASIFFCILFCYTVLRDTKDVLVVTSGGAEVIPFLKTYMNLPAAMGFTVLYASMVNKMSNQKVFYTLITCFAIFFGSFATIIYPNAHLLHPIQWATNTAAALPVGFGPILSIIKFWTYGTFYTFAELWGSVVVSLLFWGFANEICSVSEAKRWYPLFGLIANVALIFSGQFIRYVSAARGNLPPGVDPWGWTLNLLMTAVCAGATIVVGLKYYMDTKVVTDPECVPATMQRKGKKEKGPSMGLGESFNYLLSSSYIRNLAFLVIAYGTSINIVEVSWKAKLKAQYPNPNDYSAFMGAFSSSTGAITLGMMLLGRWILGRFGWGTAALVTPMMLGITGITFFSLILFKDFFEPITAALGFTPLMAAVLVGAAQNILSKSSKYSLFDPCKETAYIPLDSEMRTKGKAAIDVIGNPLGKSAGAFIQQGALLTCGSLAVATPFLGGVLFSMVGLWIAAARSLAVEFEEKAAEMQQKKDD
eukprot:gnl/TRDRNA2_/TRDRNA2_37643_c0_seq1.p1 gnl/TRDRNA2_/TRDRNA2_37643_c0~~gnl/TRDRNA2_/TRDRNA2_37643_c0_seq1.p1  ORF type:complete len:953 (-),score=252.95 gnl/TRDRNA2_/TRDRNA2_37643_c0_seq1:616-3201(-)